VFSFSLSLRVQKAKINYGGEMETKEKRGDLQRKPNSNPGLQKCLFYSPNPQNRTSLAEE